MDRNDQFTEWLKNKVLSNPEEPAANAWDKISESLDLEETWEGIGEDLELEEVWQKVDTRLERYGFLQLFERLGYGFSALAAAALLFGLWWGSGTPSGSAADELTLAPPIQKELNEAPEQQRAEDVGAALSPVEKEPEIAFAPEKAGTDFSSPPETSANSRQNTTPTSGTKSASVPSFSESSGRLEKQQEKVPFYQERTPYTAGEAIAFFAKGKPFIHFYPAAANWPDFLAPDSLQERESMERESLPATAHFPAMVAGFGSAAKLSWLVNNKTREALEKTSLITAKPAVYTDVFLTYGMRLHKNYMLQAQGYLLDWSGQRYQEYRKGSYGEVEDKLLYRSLGLSLHKAGRQLGFGSMPVYSQLNAGLYGGKLGWAQENSVAGSIETKDEYSKWHFGLQAGYGNDVYLSDNLLFNYGVRARFDLLNIYSGNAAIPASFRRTRNASLDFSISLQYILKK